MYPIPLNEILVETKTCKHCGTSFPITDKDMEFYEKVSPVFNGNKYNIPTPTLCPDCRQQRRLSFRNERKLYKRKCDATGRDIISIYAPCEMKGSLEAPLGSSPDKPFKVYHQDFWWSDKWDPMKYGREFDFERGFFEQFGELLGKVPKVGIINKGSENSEYTHISAFNKNCYLLVESSNNEDSLYGYWMQKGENNVDCSFLNSCQNCYATIDSEKCFALIGGQNCKECSESYFLKNCTNCNQCIACIGIQNKKYMILNKQYSESQYKEIRQKITMDKETISWIENEYQKLQRESPHKYSEIRNSENSTGGYITDASNIKRSFEIHDAKDVSYSAHVWFNSSDCFDVDTVGLDSSLIYESINTAVNSTSNSFCNRCWTVSQSILSSECDNSSHLFGCIGLRNKSYCILNKQYTKEEYEALVPKIIEHMMKTGEWGEFFPSSLSPFGYNETVAQEYFPLTTSSLTLLPAGEGNETFREAMVSSPSPLGEGLRVRWSLYEPPFPKVEKIIPASKLPDDITKIPDDILNWAIECEVTKKPFRIIKQELEFYRKHNLPIPKRHPDQRHLDRMALRNPRKLFEKKCDKCRKDMITTYAPDRKELVYCEECYNREVMG